MRSLRKVIAKVSQLKGGVALRFTTLIFIWFLIAHWTACGWWFIGKMGFQSMEYDECEGRPPSQFTPWVVRIPPQGKMIHGFSKSIYQQCIQDCKATCTNNCTTVACMASYDCDDNNLNPDLSFAEPDEVWHQWLTSFYWALTMLMKMPNVGPDTTLEKIYSCAIVIIGAIFFALLLGQVTALVLVLVKSGAQLRDQLVTMATFSSSRRVNAKLSAKLKTHLSAEWQVTKGMDANALLADFPTQLKGDVLLSVYSDLIDCNPGFLRCSEQLRRSMLGLLKPGIALKKQTIIAGRQFGQTIYVLMKGSLQVSQAPHTMEGNEEGKKEDSPQSRGNRRGQSMSKDQMKKQLTKMNTQNYKNKLKVRMLEKPGAVIPLDTIFEGPRVSPFSVTALNQSQLLTVEANDLARLLEQFPAGDANVVTQALDAEFKNLTDSLKMNLKPKTPAADESTRESSAGPSTSTAALEKKSSPSKAPVEMSLGDKIAKMEEHAMALVETVESLQRETSKMPLIWRALGDRVMEEREKQEAAEAAGEGSFKDEPEEPEPDIAPEAAPEEAAATSEA